MLLTHQVRQIQQYSINRVAYCAEELAILASEDIVIQVADGPQVAQQQALNP